VDDSRLSYLRPLSESGTNHWRPLREVVGFACVGALVPKVTPMVSSQIGDRCIVAQPVPRSIDLPSRACRGTHVAGWLREHPGRPAGRRQPLQSKPALRAGFAPGHYRQAGPPTAGRLTAAGPVNHHHGPQEDSDDRSTAPPPRTRRGGRPMDH
jgi:hypothetical protein